MTKITGTETFGGLEYGPKSSSSGLRRIDSTNPAPLTGKRKYRPTRYVAKGANVYLVRNATFHIHQSFNTQRQAEEAAAALNRRLAE